MGKLDGRCLCGSITYTCDAEPAMTAVCHCRNCQRSTGTSFSLVVAAPKAAFQLSGDTLGTFQTVGEEHGMAADRRFCTACGSPVITESPLMPDMVLIKAGTLDDPSWLEPQMEIWGSSAQPWLPEAEGRPRLPTGPQMG
jgi:hypothetical protein